MTLIEVLVAVTLLSILMAALFTALQVGSASWSDVRRRLTEDRAIVNANALLHAAIAGIVPVEARASRTAGLGTAIPVFFQGEPEAMRFVTAYSVTDGVRGGLQVVELLVMRTSNGLRVILNQSPYRGAESLGRLVEGRRPDADFPGGRFVFAPIRPAAGSLIVADQLSECRFSYLTPPRSVGEPSRWLPNWADPASLPPAITIHLAAEPNGSKLRPVSIVAAVRARKVHEPGNRRVGRVLPVDPETGILRIDGSTGRRR